MDFTGYRKIASTCPISMTMADGPHQRRNIASASHFSKSARSSAPPVMFRNSQKNKPALCFLVKLAHRPLSKTGATCGRGECRGPSTPPNNSLRESFGYAQDDNLELICGVSTNSARDFR
jgi:hypothetical protein